MMRKRFFGLTLGSLLLALSLFGALLFALFSNVHAQQAKKIPRVGIFSSVLGPGLIQMLSGKGCVSSDT
jgi:hypothetical protein